MIKVIFKLENGKPVLFLPNTLANIGLIAYCSPDEGHGEASLEYYYACKPMKDQQQIDILLAWYDSIGQECEPVVRAYKQTAKDRAEAYNRLT